MENDVSALSPPQQEALEQYMQVTDQTAEQAIPLLRRSEWNVQIAVAKFFDGEGPDPVAEALAQPQQIQNFQNLQESFGTPTTARPGLGLTPGSISASDPAPRVVPRQTINTRTPWLISLLLSPLSFSVRIVSTLVRSIVYILALLPASIRPRAIQGAIAPGLRSATGRRMQMPRDTAARFKREFEETYGSSALPWFEGGIAQAHDMAKNDVRFLLVVLVAPEHDDTESFVTDTLLDSETVAFITDPANRMILWGGNMLDSEAYQVSQEYNCTKFPFAALVCLTPKEGATRMGIVKRLVGPMSAANFVADIRAAMDQYRPDLDGLRAQRAAQEVARSLRTEQDSAYERSLARDRERARVRREAEAAAAEEEKKKREEEEAAKCLEEKREKWRRWRAGRIIPEPETGVRLALKLPEEMSATRVVRKFPADASMEELYAFVECFDLLGEEGGGGERPEGYVHEFGFRVASMMPRVVYLPDEGRSIGEVVGKGGNLVVEMVGEEE